MSDPLPIDVSALAAEQVHAAETWWQVHRPKAPGAIRVELARASSLIAAHPRVCTPASNAVLPDVRRLHLRRIHYDLYYRLVDLERRIEILAFWHVKRGGKPPV